MITMTRSYLDGLVRITQESSLIFRAEITTSNGWVCERGVSGAEALGKLAIRHEATFIAILGALPTFKKSAKRLAKRSSNLASFYRGLVSLSQRFKWYVLVRNAELGQELIIDTEGRAVFDYPGGREIMTSTEVNLYCRCSDGNALQRRIQDLLNDSWRSLRGEQLETSPSVSITQ